MSVDAASYVDEIEVGDLGQGRPASQNEPRRQERKVEGLAVVGDEHRRAGYALDEPLEHGRLLAELAQEELLHHERAALLEPRKPDEKRHGARAAGEPGRLGVDVHRTGWVTRDQKRVEREQREHVPRRISAHMHRRATHSVRRRETFGSHVDRTGRRFLARER